MHMVISTKVIIKVISHMLLSCMFLVISQSCSVTACLVLVTFLLTMISFSLSSSSKMKAPMMQ